MTFGRAIAVQRITGLSQSSAAFAKSHPPTPSIGVAHSGRESVAFQEAFKPLMVADEFAVPPQKLEGKAGRVKFAFGVIRGSRSPVGLRHGGTLQIAPPPWCKHGESPVDC